MNQITLSPPGAFSSLSDTAITGPEVGNMDMGDSCKISMLWNWNTIDACFISKSWRITSNGMFAGSCIGVILLVMSLEFLRRLSKEYDRYILRHFKQALQIPRKAGASLPASSPPPKATASATSGLDETSSNPPTCANIPTTTKEMYYFRPTLVQQSVRALLHMVTFAVAYFIMLLAMYYNGYFIICIFIGAYLGSFAFSWEGVSVSIDGPDMGKMTVAMEDVTVCCG
ncbi:Ctr copper transporter family protein [Talaromyces stipitatus ATCC 10500]|uniref:Copper transport protein n=1 Tax=Talaromyces stipitatus (strain ATCC 10500 / CBS 375.48 / QM 6759 / NRRL 1006) TaxID=441959 RepID=B8MR81_TALSN|nr:Ctr copper transporter family protein [Talaromyces stipitatus ATCC 10500]EED12976.1 Ctr copper transporter family protein [Talaromyces stipitatus ATCC 10500]